jgi:hypothetical protein
LDLSVSVYHDAGVSYPVTGFSGGIRAGTGGNNADPLRQFLEIVSKKIVQFVWFLTGMKV